MTWAAVLVGAAVVVVLQHPPSGRRLSALLPGLQAPVPETTERTRRLACMGLGLVVWWLAGGVLGAALGLAVAAAGPSGLARLEDREARVEQELLAQLPLALDLLAACLAGGGSPVDALRAVSRAVGGPCGVRFGRVAAALAVGTPPDLAFGELGRSGPAGAAGRALCRASAGGTPVAGAVSRVAGDARRRARAEARRRARRAGVLAAGPLTTCFLPAFLLIGIVPCVVGVVGPLVGAL